MIVSDRLPVTDDVSPSATSGSRSSRRVRADQQVVGEVAGDRIERITEVDALDAPIGAERPGDTHRSGVRRAPAEGTGTANATWDEAHDAVASVSTASPAVASVPATARPGPYPLWVGAAVEASPAEAATPRAVVRPEDPVAAEVRWWPGAGIERFPGGHRRATAAGRVAGSTCGPVGRAGPGCHRARGRRTVDPVRPRVGRRPAVASTRQSGSTGRIGRGGTGGGLSLVGISGPVAGRGPRRPAP